MRVEGRILVVEDCYKSKIINGGKGDALPSIPEVLGLSRGDILVPTPVENSPAKSWQVGEYALIRAYSKEMIAGGNKKKIQKIVRLERQEYPNKTFEEAIDEKLGGF